jgi:hypothetical protein
MLTASASSGDPHASGRSDTALPKPASDPRAATRLPAFSMRLVINDTTKASHSSLTE